MISEIDILVDNLFLTFRKMNVNFDKNLFSFFNNKSAKFKFYSTNNLNISLEDLSSINNSENVIVLNDNTYNILLDNKINSNLIKIKIPFSWKMTNNNKLNLKGVSEYNFLSVIDTRTNTDWDVIVESFCMSFKKEDKVSLILKIHNGDYQIFSQQQIVKKIFSIKEKFKDSPNIVFLGEEMSDIDFFKLFFNANCFIDTSMINLGYSFLQAYMSGCHCIGPSKSSIEDIIRIIDGDLVPTKSKSKKVNGIINNNYDCQDIGKTMKLAYERKAELKEKNVKRRKLIINDFICQNVVLDFLNKVKQ